jgi:predicted dithiol-disulfide oxidoreductase (DUF899 family)
VIRPRDPVVATVQPRSIARAAGRVARGPRQQMLVEEKALTRARDALAAERRRMPWMPVEKAYEFEGPNGKVTDDHLDFSSHRLVGESR